MCFENGFQGDNGDAFRTLSIVFTTLGRPCLTPRGNIAAHTWKNLLQIWNQLYSTSQPPQTIDWDRFFSRSPLTSPQDIANMRYVFKP